MMDDRTFDRLARAFAASGSRRRVLRGFLAAGVAAVGGAAGTGGADARRCRRLGKRCERSSDCCGYTDNRCDQAARQCVRCLPGGTPVPKHESGFGCKADLCCSFSCAHTAEGGICD